MLDGFRVSHTKDKVLFEGEEEEALEKFLVKGEGLRRIMRRAGAVPGAAQSGQEQVRDLVKGRSNSPVPK